MSDLDSDDASLPAAVNDCLVDLTNVATNLLDGDMALLDAWRRLESRFDSNAVSNVPANVLRLVTDLVFADELAALHSTARLVIIARLFRTPRSVTLFVMKRQSNNATVVTATRNLLGRGQPAVTFSEFYETAEQKCRERLTVNRPVQHATLIRETFKAFGDFIWPSPAAAPHNALVQQALVLVPAPAPAQDQAQNQHQQHLQDQDEGPEEAGLQDQFPPVSEDEEFMPQPARSSSPMAAGFDQTPVGSQSPEVGRHDNANFDPDASSLDPVLSPIRIDKDNDAELLGGDNLPAASQPQDAIDPQRQRAIVPFVELVESVMSRLAPGQWLNDNIINTTLSRLSSEHLGVVSSFFLGSPRLLEPFRHLFATKSMILIPAHDEEATHWRLYVWSSPNQLAVLDPMLGLPDNTTDRVSRAIEAIIEQNVELSAAAVPQQPNAYDCGVFVVRFAQWVASASQDTVTDSLALRCHVAGLVLISEAATLPPWTPKGNITALMKVS
ncbi:uncharacterized protein FTOL_08597 [Fusarium torulosum]|uniref:Ubiquitin-like protease family profile domain-containing protein n=1 Tax=Fusarium torulosum TaxID=33205 RepID=A0AAE8MD29_9HYPO|nr:uncharacterized protein FTOL_08597 [Fusarium torulosum]